MKICKYYRLTSLIMFIVIMLFSANNCVGKRIQVESKTKIIFEKYDTEYFKLKRYLLSLDNLTTLLLRSRHNVKLLPKIVVMDKKKMKRDVNVVPVGKSVNIYINGNFEYWRNKAAVNKQIISALLFTKCDIKPGRAALPDWLLTGIYAELKLKTTRKIFSPSIYLPGVIALTRAGKIPELAVVTSHPVKEIDGVAYQLYEEFCQFLLSASKDLCRNDDEAFAEIVVLAATGNYSQQEIFSSTLGRVAAKRYGSSQQTEVDDSQVAEQWFRRTLINKMANYFFPFSAKNADRKFNELFPVKCEVSIGGGKFQQVSLPLLQLPEYWSRIKEPFTVQSSISNKLGKLAIQSPIAMALKLHIIRRQISILGTNSAEAEKTALKKALNNYHRALVQQSAIENHLAAIEQRDENMSKYYNRQLGVFRQGSDNPWREMKQYLDSVERKYME